MSNSSSTQQLFLRGVWIAGVAVAALTLAVSGTPAMTWLENGTYDARVRWSAQPKKADPRIVIIDIDNPSLEVLQDKLGRWPWTRRVWTEVIRYVGKGKPKAVAVDIIFGGAENEQVDSALAQVLRTSGNVVIGFSFLSTHLEMSAEDTAVTEQKARAMEPWSLAPGMGETFAPQDFSPNRPLETLATSAAGLGSLNSAPDSDGNVRRVALQVQYRDRAYPSLAAKTVDIATNRSGLVWHRKQNWFDSNYAAANG